MREISEFLPAESRDSMKKSFSGSSPLTTAGAASLGSTMPSMKSSGLLNTSSSLADTLSKTMGPTGFSESVLDSALKFSQSQKGRKGKKSSFDPTASGYGTAKGAAWVEGRWLREHGVKSFLDTVHPKLPRSAQLKNASGRYSGDVDTAARSPSLRSLPQIRARNFEEVITKHAGDRVRTLLAPRNAAWV